MCLSHEIKLADVKVQFRLRCFGLVPSTFSMSYVFFTLLKVETRLNVSLCDFLYCAQYDCYHTQCSFSFNVTLATGFSGGPRPAFHLRCFDRRRVCRHDARMASEGADEIGFSGCLRSADGEGGIEEWRNEGWEKALALRTTGMYYRLVEMLTVSAMSECVCERESERVQYII